MDEKRVRDLMLSLSEYATVPSGSTIRDALVELTKAQLGLTHDRHHHRAVLVIGPRGRILGKLTHWAILRSIDPGFLGRSDRYSLDRAGLPEQFISSLEQGVAALGGSLARICREAGRMRVDEAMVPTGESIEADAFLTEAIRRMVETHQQSMLVTREGEVVGILRLSDVFQEVAEAIGRDDAG